MQAPQPRGLHGTKVGAPGTGARGRIGPGRSTPKACESGWDASMGYIYVWGRTALDHEMCR